MPLKGGVRLILQAEQADGAFSCQSFEVPGIQNPVQIALAGCGTPLAAQQVERLRAAIESEVLRSPGARPATTPGGRAMAALGDHPMAELGCQALLVLVGDGRQPAPLTPALEAWAAGGPATSILPILPATARVRTQRLLPAELHHLNVNFWSATPAEAVHGIFARTGITAEQARIFISYRQTESAAVAMQLFDALSHEGFDVFLDHFRIAPGVNFQARLTQELGDKSMVVLLESPDILSSDWILYEINVAKACGLGLFAIHLPGGRRVPGIDDEYRHGVEPTELVGPAGPGAELTSDAIERIVEVLKREHDRALVRRRAIARSAFEGAVLEAGGRPPTIEAPGCLRVAGNERDYLVFLAPRPPGLPDFHILHGAAKPPVTGVIMGLSRLLEPPRIASNGWLSGLCDIRIVDEGEMKAAARMMVEGILV